MALGNVGQRCPLIYSVDGETAGPAVFEVLDPAIAEVREVDGTNYAYLLAQGSSEVRIHIPLPGPGGRELTASGLVVVNDPADDAKVVEFTVGDAEDAPAP